MKYPKTASRAEARGRLTMCDTPAVVRIMTLAIFIALAAALCAQPAPQPPPGAQPPAAPAPQTASQTAAPPVGELMMNNASLTTVIDQLARALHLNVIVDPRVGSGGVTINTYGETKNIDARSLLDLILRINNAAMIQVGEFYRIVPLNAISNQPIHPEVNARDMPEDDQTMLNLIFLKYINVDELVTVLKPFTGENATIYSYGPANLLFLFDSRRNMRRTMELVQLFDSDTFASSRVRLFELTNARPSDVVKDLDSILKSISLSEKSGTVRFLPVDRINTLIAVAPNPGVFDTVEEWIKKLDVPVKVTAGAVEVHVYRVKYGRADCLAMALGQLYGYSTASSGSAYPGYGAGMASGQGMPTNNNSFGGGGFGGGYGGNFGNGGGGYGNGNGNGTSTYGNGNAFNNGFGGTGACTGGANGASNGSYGVPTFGGYSAQVPATAVGQPAAAAPSASAGESRPRIVPNPLDNALIIQADAQQYQGILKILKDLDVPPRQILLEAKIYSVDLSGSFSSGISAVLRAKTGADRSLLGSLGGSASGAVSTMLQAGTVVGQSRELLAFLNLQENASRAHVISEPSLIATDSIPASINVGTQIPVSTGQTTIPTSGNVTTVNNISSQNTGVTMQVNARVNPSGVVTLIINQEISSPAAGSTGSLTPSFNQQVVQTQITVMDGDTIAIGGLISENNTSTSAGIPGLNRLPVVGAIFGTRSYNHDRSELIIFMTPHVIYDETGLLEASDELKGRIKNLRKYVKEQ